MKIATLLGYISIVAATAIGASSSSAQTGKTTVPAAFSTCRTCHNAAAGQANKVGPNLFGIFGKPAASTPGFAYSAALKKSNLRWDARTLDEFLASPIKKVPGTKMPIATPDATKRKAIIEFLMTAK